MCILVKVLVFQKLELELNEMSTGFSTRQVEKALSIADCRLPISFYGKSGSTTQSGESAGPTKKSLLSN
jgi:hypothetical protein